MAGCELVPRFAHEASTWGAGAKPRRRPTGTMFDGASKARRTVASR